MRLISGLSGCPSELEGGESRPYARGVPIARGVGGGIAIESLK